jgi:vancomycin permeability regulator SanA
VPNIDVIRRGILIGFVTKLGSGSSGVLEGRNLIRSSTLPIATTGVVGTLQIVFTNSITTTYVNRIANQLSMNSMITRRYINVNVMNPRKGYQEPSTINVQIPNYKTGHHVRPNKVAFKYPNF